MQMSETLYFNLFEFGYKKLDVWNMRETGKNEFDVLHGEVIFKKISKERKAEAIRATKLP